MEATAVVLSQLTVGFQAAKYTARVFLPHPGVQSPKTERIDLRELLMKQFRRRRVAAVE
jgi:hypothetical protein